MFINLIFKISKVNFQIIPFNFFHCSSIILIKINSYGFISYQHCNEMIHSDEEYRWYKARDAGFGSGRHASSNLLPHRIQKLIISITFYIASQTVLTDLLDLVFNIFSHTRSKGYRINTLLKSEVYDIPDRPATITSKSNMVYIIHFTYRLLDTLLSTKGEVVCYCKLVITFGKLYFCLVL